MSTNLQPKPRRREYEKAVFISYPPSREGPQLIEAILHWPMLVSHTQLEENWGNKMTLAPDIMLKHKNIGLLISCVIILGLLPPLAHKSKENVFVKCFVTVEKPIFSPKQLITQSTSLQIISAFYSSSFNIC